MIGSEIIRINSCPSTNQVAVGLARDRKHSHGAVVVTHNQTKGKGQQGNSWESEEGKNLTFSLILYPEALHAEHQFRLSMAASLAICRLTRSYGLESLIKWPNDIRAGNGKLAGILIETGIMGNLLEYAVIGIGLNVNQLHFFSNAPDPVSMAGLLGKDFDSGELMALFLSLFNPLYDLCLREDPGLESDYLHHLYGYEHWCSYSDQNGTFEGRILGLGPFGQLRLEDREGRQRIYAFKEIRFLT